jgi:hypothetical protein
MGVNSYGLRANVAGWATRMEKRLPLDSDEALAVSEKTLAREIRRHGPAHSRSVNAMDKVANCLVKSGRLEESSEIRKNTLAMRQLHFGQNIEETLNTEYWLSRTLIDLGRSDEAKPYLREVVASWSVILGQEFTATVDALQWPNEVKQLVLGEG